MRLQHKSVLALTIITVCAASAGLFPGLIRAGDLNPTGPPGSTMKTLDEIPPSWSQILDSTDGEVDGCNSTRFVCVMGGAAVLDKETGLVWERSPDTGTRSWFDACDHCYRRKVTNRKGWRLPSVEELASLIDMDTADFLPGDHPFSNVQYNFYWSSTTYPENTTYGWGWRFNQGTLTFVTKGSTYYAWCVRGGHGHDGY